MTKDDALKLALEAIQELRYSSSTFKADKLSAAAITAIEQALAQPAQPDSYAALRQDIAVWKQRPWVGLTDAESRWIYDNCRTPAGMMAVVEAKLKEKNHD